MLATTSDWPGCFPGDVMVGGIKWPCYQNADGTCRDIGSSFDAFDEHGGVSGGESGG